MILSHPKVNVSQSVRERVTYRDATHLKLSISSYLIQIAIMTRLTLLITLGFLGLAAKTPCTYILLVNTRSVAGDYRLFGKLVFYP